MTTSTDSRQAGLRADSSGSGPAAGSTAAEPQRASAARRSGRLVSTLLPALLVLVAVLGVGTAYVLTRPSQWTASASFAVLPSTGDPDTEAGYYETLSRGQIVSTVAQVVAAQAQNLPDGTQVDVEVLPETSLVRLVTTAPDAETATAVTDAQLAAGITAVEQLGIPFAARVVDQPAQTLEEVPPNTVTNLAIIILAALGLALAVQQGLALVLRLLQQRAADAQSGVAGSAR